MIPIDVNSYGLFDLGEDAIPESLKRKVQKCIAMQKAVAAREFHYVEDEEAENKVSEEALRVILQKGDDVHGISTDSGISNVICFGAHNIEGAVEDAQVKALRTEVDLGLQEYLLNLFAPADYGQVVTSGHFWYPHRSAMGWHTNSQVPGWRIYINYAESEGESFFRYRDPLSGKLITLEDETWNLRVFRVTDSDPLWHCVYSNTNRFSLGYLLRKSPQRSVLRRVYDRLLG